MVYELQPRYDSRKSFYGKAFVGIYDDGRKELHSYTTKVVTIKDNKATVHGTHSKTTLMHIKEFLKQQGFIADTKAQIERDYK